AACAAAHQTWHRPRMSANPPAGEGRADPPAGPGDPSRPPGRSPRRRILSWLAVLTLGLLVVNFWAASRATQAPSRVRVPYSPLFLAQVRVGNVAEIMSRGTAIQGTFRHEVRFDSAKSTTRFKTEIPSFADTKALSQLLERKRVVVNAVALDTGAPLWENLLLGFLPTLLLIGLLYWLFRRAGNVRGML